MSMICSPFSTSSKFDANISIDTRTCLYATQTHLSVKLKMFTPLMGDLQIITVPEYRLLDTMSRLRR
ncbi:hypothetical protein Mapa_013298 [Marchantia paleacea]|nr:hypothetical protein Mapa_013298 [Marchantia paleacea]